jgi:hypothetical protein
MKKYLIFMMMFIMAIGAFGQTSAEATVTATVQAELTLVNDVAINFGALSATSTPIMDPKDVSHTDLGQTYTMGEFTMGGSNGVDVNVSYDASVTLGDETNTITYTPSVFGHETTQAASAVVSNGANVTLGASGYKLWVGGNLGTLSGQATGVYTAAAGNGSGNFTITLEYN